MSHSAVLSLPFVFDGSPDERVDRLITSMGGVWDQVDIDAPAAGTLWFLGQNILTRIVDEGQRTQTRSMSAVRKDQMDQYRVVLQLERDFRCEADGKRIVVKPGQIIFTDLARPETFCCDRTDCLILFIPRSALDDLLPRPVDLHGWMPQGAAAMLLADHLRAVLRTAPLLSGAEVPGLNMATLHMLAATIAPNIDTLGNARPTIECALVRQAKRHIHTHLTDPTLSPEHICRTLRISRATLYRLFEPDGGVAQFIRQQRLLRAHMELASASTKLTLERLADNLGFNGASQFSRSFRTQFGYSPSEVGRLGLRGTSAPASRVEGQSGSFSASMRQMV
jgi:AraC-like DNA-binding protein